jgi:hypothetical protein
MLEVTYSMLETQGGTDDEKTECMRIWMQQFIEKNHLLIKKKQLDRIYISIAERKFTEVQAILTANLRKYCDCNEYAEFMHECSSCGRTMQVALIEYIN